MISKSSDRISWWTCPKCKSDYDTVTKVRGRGGNCPYCSGNRINDTNSLLVIRPDIAIEWDYEKNMETSPKTIAPNNYRKVWWICPDCDSSYNSSPNKRVQGRSCPYCAGVKVNHTNSLASLNPSLAKEWHPTKNGKWTPDNVTCGSDYKAWWICESGHEWEIGVQQRNKAKSGCPYCSGHRVWTGFNDLWTTHAYLAVLLVDEREGYKHSYGSNVKLDWKCSSCELRIKKVSVAHVVKRGVLCPICSKGISIPEKIMSNVLKNSNVEFIYNRSFEWSDGRQYDFYLPEYNLIIETHGDQHYRETGRKGARILAEEQENDRYKEQLARENGIEHYIVIDCRRSEFEFIKNNIEKSNLINLLPKLNLDMRFTIKNENLIRSCELWSEGMESTVQIGEVLGIGKGTVRSLLLLGTELGKCNYGFVKRGKKLVKI